MARCKDCIHDKVCNRDIGHGYSICPHYVNTADVAPRAEWISVEERLPEQYGLFLIADDKGNMEVASWTKQFGWFSGGNRVKRVTHWMPLPEPPKGE